MNLKAGVFYESYVEKSKTKNTKEFQMVMTNEFMSKIKKEIVKN